MYGGLTQKQLLRLPTKELERLAQQLQQLQLSIEELEQLMQQQLVLPTQQPTQQSTNFDFLENLSEANNEFDPFIFDNHEYDYDFQI